jgi:hypothetical protein
VSDQRFELSGAQVPASILAAVTALGVFATLVSLSLMGRALISRPVEDFSAQVADLIQPNPQLGPGDVVELQLRALASATSNENGLLQCYCFASPLNRRATGPFPRFREMIRSPSYRPMLDQLETHVGRPLIRDRYARVLATFVDSNQRIHVYHFELSKQTAGSFENCWMTDRVFSVSNGQSEPIDVQPLATATRLRNGAT